MKNPSLTEIDSDLQLLSHFCCCCQIFVDLGVIIIQYSMIPFLDFVKNKKEPKFLKPKAFKIMACSETKKKLGDI